MKRVVLIAAAVLVLAGCGQGSSNQDPRLGRVVTEHSNCLWGACRYSWNICVGPDWVVHIDGTKERTFKDAAECKR